MNRKANVVLLAPIPALCVGAIIMHANGVGATLYGQNILCYLILCLFAFLLRSRDVRIRSTQPALFVFLALCCVLLAGTFLDKGLDHVHRWLAIGGFRLYISSLILPSAIVGISILLRRKSTVLAVILSATIAVLLLLQPDASQLTAFVAAAIVIFCRTQSPGRVSKYGMAFVGVALILYAWINLDALAPVPHVERILFLALDMGVTWFIVGILSLALLVIPFFAVLRGSPVAKALGCYYAAIIASTFLGNFPVPFMGQGVSPIIGYLLAAFLLLQSEATCNTVTFIGK